MASRIIHLAITDCLLKGYSYKDKNRLELGSILPDAVTSGNSHLKIIIANGTKNTYDLTSFRFKYLSKMKEDDLYLGYYLHLVQYFFTREMADEFITYASEKCKQEIDSLCNGLACVDERALAWQRR